MNNPFEPYKLQFSNDERKKLVAETIKELRELKKLQQKELCEILDISPSTYNGYEKGRNEPPIEFLVRLAYFYGVSMDLITQKDLLFKTQEEVVEQAQEYKTTLIELRKQLFDADNENNILDNPELVKMFNDLGSIVDILENNVPQAIEILKTKISESEDEK